MGLAVEYRFGPKRGFGATPGELSTISNNPYPKPEKPPGRQGGKVSISEIPSLDSTVLCVFVSHDELSRFP